MPRNHPQIVWNEVMAAVAARGASLSPLNASMRKGNIMLMTSILAVYRSCPVMIVAETEEGCCWNSP
jgi:hypothetical protein